MLHKWESQIGSGDKIIAKWNFDKISGVADFALGQIVRFANSGNDMAAKELHWILERHVSHLIALCFENPKAFEPIACKIIYWPAFISRHSETKEQNEKLIGLLHLGRDSGLNLSGKTWSTKTVEVNIALQLYRTLDRFRLDWIEKPAYKRMRAEMRKENKRLGKPANYRPPTEAPLPTTPAIQEWLRLMDESRQLAKNLQPLNRDNYDKWFEASLPDFRSRYGEDFENRKCFDHYWKSDAFMESDPLNLGKKRLKKRARGDIRDAIKKKIKQAFRSIAPKS